MGLVTGSFVLGDPRNPALQPVAVDALADSGALHLIPMEDMDLVVIPRTRTIDVNPDRPNVATSLAKRIRAA